MIPRIHDKGTRVGGLVRYLYGPGKREEHTNPRIVAAWEGAPRTALLEPQLTDSGRRDFRGLIEALEEPVFFGDRPPPNPVWHLSVRLAPEDRTLSDQAWEHIAREFMNRTGLARYGDTGCVRWVAIRHGDDHIHIAATLVRQDGRTDPAWNDRYLCRAAAIDLEQRYGLRRTGPADRTTHRRPHPVEISKSRRLGRVESARDELRRRVRTAAAASVGEDEFFTRLREAGVLVTLRESQLNPGEITGYAVALPGVKNAADGRPIFYGGGRLAPDLTLPKLRERWAAPADTQPGAGRPQSPGGQRVTVTRPQRVRALREAAEKVAAATEEMRRHSASGNPQAAQPIAQAAADTLATVAYAIEGRDGGPLTRAAEMFDRAAREAYGKVVRATSRSYELRAMSRVVALLGRVSGDDDAVAALALVLDLARLGDTLAHLRQVQRRLHQAQAATAASVALRAYAATSGGGVVAAATTPTSTAGPTVGGGRRPHRGRR